jgi:hypothetical protein
VQGLDRLLIIGRRQLEHVLRIYIRTSTSSAQTAHSTYDRRAREPT